MRKIVVDDIEFEWKVGRTHLRIRRPGDTRDIRLFDFLEKQGIPIAGNRWPDKEVYSITPSDIEAYIRKHMLSDSPSP